MALSYEDSVAKYLAESTSEEQTQTITVTNDDEENEYSIALADVDDTDTDNTDTDTSTDDAGTDDTENEEETTEETWEVNDNYAWYDEYSDENYSYVDNMKDITLDDTQINLTQETVSQFIPFKMPRYYDGIDLNNMTIMFHYVTPKNKDGYSAPVNVSYTDDTIKFAWLVDGSVTSYAGTVKFEICITGFNEKDEAYLWRTLPNGKLNIISSLSGDGVAEPNDDYLVTLINALMGDVLTSLEDKMEEYFQKALEDASHEEYYTKSEIDDILSEFVKGVIV